MTAKVLNGFFMFVLEIFDFKYTYSLLLWLSEPSSNKKTRIEVL